MAPARTARAVLRRFRHGHGPALAATVALGAALAGPALALAHGRLAHPRPAPPGPDWDRPGGWTAQVRVPETLRADALDGLVGVALAVAVLLLAGTSVNLVTLLLSRAAARRHATAVRAVLGATPARLGLGAMAEGALLGLAGGGAGVLLGAAAGALARGRWPGGDDLLARFGPAAGAALVAGVLTLPLLAAAALPFGEGARRRLYAALSAGPRATGGPGEAMLRKALAVLQFGASATVLAGAAVLLRGALPAPAAASAGLDPRDTLVFRVRLPDVAHPERAELQRALLAAAGGMPGVRNVSASTPGAWLGLGAEDVVRTLCDACIMGNMYYPMGMGRTRHHVVSPGHFGGAGPRVLAGRALRVDDRRAVVINRAFANRLLPRADPVGQRVLLSAAGSAEPYRVVGVVDDPRVMAPGAGAHPEPALYLPSMAHPPRTLSLAVRTEGAPAEREGAVRRALARAAPGARVSRGVEMQALLDRERAPLRWFGTLLGVLAAGATLVAGGGLYGTMTFSVARRTREIGVRMAVGATERDVLRGVLREALQASVLGAVVGSIGAVTMGHALHQAVYGVEALDPAAYLAVAAVLAAVTLAGAYGPARRAARVHPNEALRPE